VKFHVLKLKLPSAKKIRLTTKDKKVGNNFATWQELEKAIICSFLTAC
jgi:hypothetical protein